MNYFEIFEMPIQYALDVDQLKRTYLKKSRQYHPDYFIHASADDQATALQRTAEFNQGLKVLSDPDLRLKHLLQLRGVLEEDEKYNLEPAFLMEVMDINEQLMELEMEPNPVIAETIQKQTNELLEESYQEVSTLLEARIEGDYTQEALLQLKSYYFRKKYLQRILDKIDGVAPPM